jgi:hypothetical protein
MLLQTTITDNSLPSIFSFPFTFIYILLQNPHMCTVPYRQTPQHAFKSIPVHSFYCLLPTYAFANNNNGQFTTFLSFPFHLDLYTSYYKTLTCIQYLTDRHPSMLSIPFPFTPSTAYFLPKSTILSESSICRH